MVTEENARWLPDYPQIPKRMGNIYDIDKFDAQFFGVHFKQAESLDPQSRLLQERAYEAIIDAGVHPKSLRGSATGVFIGAGLVESDKTLLYENRTERGFGITGCYRTMLANRISYSLGFQGPSLVVDTGCSSSTYALDMAFNYIRNGHCDSAIVGGSNLLLQPAISLQFAQLGVLAHDGCCRPFDKDACGFVRSEAIAVVFLQKSKNAKRIYANLLYSKTNCDGHKMQGITYPSSTVQKRLLTEFYSESGIDPGNVYFVEAHGTGTVVGDPEECAALDIVMCQNRTEPLLVGSVKSNMGHSEGTSGLSGLTKVLLSFERGEVPANLNFKSNSPDISSLVENRIKVCAEITQLPKNALIGINSFGIGGSNSHALLRGNFKSKINGGRPDDNIPRLVNWSGRTKESISKMLDYLRNAPLDAEYIGLLHNIESIEEPGFVHRGFGVFAKGLLNGDPAICLSSDEQRHEGIKRPLVWIFSGMGSQWPGMGSSLMSIPLFKDSILTSHLILEPFGIDLVRIITDSDKHIFDNILHSFVGIAAIQIALVDVLTALDIQPDFLIGHSVGELGCAYADGVLNQEQMILSAYYRGLVSDKSKLICGSMAAVGIGYSELKDMLPMDIDAACHNSAESSTISGPKESVAAFLVQLESQNIFVKEVNTSNIAYHSRYVAGIANKLIALTKDLFTPARRSDKWLSTSVPKNEWNEPKNRICSADYFANNLINSVLFEETCALLPENALAIEIAPHGLLQAIIKRSLPTYIHIPLTQRSSKNNDSFLLAALGKLYLNGWTLPLEKLYPSINYPVSRGTAKISPLLVWDHSVSYFVPKFDLNQTPESCERLFTINLSKDEFSYIAGHQIDGPCLFPATGYLEMVWKTLSTMKRKEQMLLNVEFEDVQFHRATSLHMDTDVELKVVIHYGNGSFEVSEGSTSVVTGFVREVNDNNAILTDFPQTSNSTYTLLNQDDFYKELRLRGYHYKGEFQSVTNARSDGSGGIISWDNNWVTFMDCILQTMILSTETRSLKVPSRIQWVRILPKEHQLRITEQQSQTKVFETKCNQYLNIIQSGGIEFVGLVTKDISRGKSQGKLVLESYQFVRYNPGIVLSQYEAYRICIQLLLENNPTLSKFKVLEVDSLPDADPVVTLLEEIFTEILLVTVDLTLLTNHDVKLANVNVQYEDISAQSNCHLVILKEVSTESDFYNSCQNVMADQGFLIVRVPYRSHLTSFDWPTSDLNIIAEILTATEKIFLLRKRQITSNNQLVIDISNSQSFDWIDKVKESGKSTSLVLVSQHDTFSGILGLVNCIRLEPEIMNVNCVFIDDENAPTFDIENPLYANQLSLNLAINVYRDGSWGSYRHLTLNQETELKPRTGHFFVNILRQGDLSSLTWMQGPLNSQTHDQVVRIQYSAINFKDVMLGTGRLSSDRFIMRQDSLIGVEYAGTLLHGQRVMGIVPYGGISTIVKPYSPFVWNVPDKWSLEEAATVPVVYSTVYFAFFIGKAISAGKSILIHSGSGGVGLAAIRVALAYGMEVFTTVSNVTKKRYILELYPMLKESNIGNSRDCSFEQLIKLRTRGKGVDFVLNSLSDEKLQASIRCLGIGGVFLEIGKFDLSNDTKIGLGVFLKELSFRSVLLDNCFYNKENDDESRLIHDLIQQDIQTGIIQPLKSTVFQANEIENAFRFLSTSQHIGKVLIQLRRNSQEEMSAPINPLPRVYFEAEKVYIIPGGLGGFGLELVDWMVLRGARNIVLSSSRGITTTYQAYRKGIWENYGCHIKISKADISTPFGCRLLIDEAQKYGQIDGIFNLAVTLRDAIFENQTAEKFKECAAPKSIATINLDEIARKCCQNLKYFVVFSSVACCGRGMAGQTSYGMANSVMERVIEKRVSDGLSGKAIQWGAIGDVGLIGARSANDVNAELCGMVLQRISSCINEMDILLTTPDPIVSNMVVAKKHSTATINKKASLIEVVLNIMSIQCTKSISMNTYLAELGADSLMTIEIKQTLERMFNIYLSSKELRLMTFQQLQVLSDNKSYTKIISKEDAQKSGTNRKSFKG